MIFRNFPESSPLTVKLGCLDEILACNEPVCWSNISMINHWRWPPSNPIWWKQKFVWVSKTAASLYEQNVSVRTMRSPTCNRTQSPTAHKSTSFHSLFFQLQRQNDFEQSDFINPFNPARTIFPLTNFLFFRVNVCLQFLLFIADELGKWRGWPVVQSIGRQDKLLHLLSHEDRDKSWHFIYIDDAKQESLLSCLKLLKLWKAISANRIYEIFETVKL